MKQISIFVLLLIFFACNNANNTGIENNETEPQKIEPKKTEPERIVLSETKLGTLELENLNKHNVENAVKAAFPNSAVYETTGKRDGPDFFLYEVKENDELIFFLTIEEEEDDWVQELWTANKKYSDMFGIAPGELVEMALAKRPDLIFFADLHYNVYAGTSQSNIQYKLSGNFKPLNEDEFVAQDYSLENWQVSDMLIEHILWRR